MTTNHSRKQYEPEDVSNVTKERVCLTIDKELYKQFRQTTKKYMQPRSALVERYIKTYVQSKIWETDIL